MQKGESEPSAPGEAKQRVAWGDYSARIARPAREIVTRRHPQDPSAGSLSLFPVFTTMPHGGGVVRTDVSVRVGAGVARQSRLQRLRSGVSPHTSRGPVVRAGNIRGDIRCASSHRGVWRSPNVGDLGFRREAPAQFAHMFQVLRIGLKGPAHMPDCRSAGGLIVTPPGHSVYAFTGCSHIQLLTHRKRKAVLELPRGIPARPVVFRGAKMRV